MSRFIIRTLFLSVLSLSILAGCSAPKNGAVQAVENYLQAMVAKDTTRITNYACSNWEAQAQTDADSFAGVTVQIQDLACQVSGTNGSTTLVTCTGKIITSYNGENTELDLAARTYKAVQEGGEWRMCGYQ
jgi:hypothetical protein